MTEQGRERCDHGETFGSIRSRLTITAPNPYFPRKYYACGVGKFLEVDPESGEVVRLVGCNVDPRCAVPFGAHAAGLAGAVRRTVR